jgi:NADPH-dependent curcumin reductase CurA
MGKDVPCEDIVDTAIRENAAIIGLSALMTTTMMRMQDVVELCKEKGCKSKVIIGGACITQSFADEIGQPKAGETVVVAAATGAVGSVVGQIAKLKGCRVVGIAGGAEKCRYAVEELGFDACIDHRSPSLSAELAAACPQGIDVYFENVGGAVFDAVLPLLNTGARVPLCGLIAQYNATELPNGPDRSPLLMRTLLTKRIRMQGFIIFDDYGHRYPEFLQAMGSWVSSGAIRHREDIVTGLENAPQAFAGLLEGRNFGKLIIQVSEINSSALMP